MKFLCPLGRVLFALNFVVALPYHFTHGAVQAAAGQGVMLPALVVPLSGVLAFIGGLSVALGYKARWGAWALVAFLVPVTLYMHAFWRLSDPQMTFVEEVLFLKNISMLGGALLISQLGAGPTSFDQRNIPG
ncbi:DoxX family protein [Silvibacterium acidisoli]|uniref:DoxX family protein n=1 Tax=Acidobacteriaceae bacterium ZG23-2 TaxID=2883246 RepID=UPI00406BF213